MLSDLPPISIDETLARLPGRVDLWWYRYEPTFDDAARARFSALLTDNERDRHERFHFTSDRDLFLATRVLARHALSRYAHVAPADWRFVATDHGKPLVEHPPLPFPIHFNLANTHGLVVCAVSCSHTQIGVDAESIDRGQAAAEAANTHFSLEERQALGHLPRVPRARRFVELWTLKESYIKARGLGLSLPLDAFSMRLDGPEIKISFDSRIADSPARWRFVLLDAGEGALAAVAADTGGKPLDLRGSAFQP